MKYLKEKKEFEKKFVKHKLFGNGVWGFQADGVWSWIVSKFQSHDRKMLEWMRDTVETFSPSYNFLGEPRGKTGFAIDKRDLTKVINQKLKEMGK